MVLKKLKSSNVPWHVMSGVELPCQIMWFNLVVPGNDLLKHSYTCMFICKNLWSGDCVMFFFCDLLMPECILLPCWLWVWSVKRNSNHFFQKHSKLQIHQHYSYCCLIQRTYIHSPKKKNDPSLSLQSRNAIKACRAAQEWFLSGHFFAARLTLATKI